MSKPEIEVQPVDGSFVEANTAKESRIPREQLVEAAQVHHTCAGTCKK